MANTNIDALYPEFWAAAFAEGDDLGGYNLQNFCSRQYEGLVGQMGDTVNVPLIPSVAAADWTPGDAITATGVTQTTAQIILNKSKKSTIALTDKELSLSPYDLIKAYGIPMAQGILSAINTEIYKEALKSSYISNIAHDAIDEDDVVDARILLNNNKVGQIGRVLIGCPDDIGLLLKKDAFQYANYSGDAGQAMKEGKLIRKFGFDIVENYIIATYTPADLTGAINNAAGYAAGDTTFVVDGFNDDANLLRAGDLITFGAGATGTFSIYSTTLAGGDTTGIVAKYRGAGLDAGVLDDAVISVHPSRSLLAMVPAGLALAARPYAPKVDGAKSTIVNYMGLPVRVTVWNDSSTLNTNVQFDVLFGIKLIDEKKVVRIVTA